MLAWILFTGAALCLAYFFILLFYAGIGTSYLWLWLFFAAFLGMTAASDCRFQRNPGNSVLRLLVTLITLCAAGVVIMLVLQILIFSGVPKTAEPDLEYLIVLGARVKEDGISKTLKLRLDKAAEYAAENPATVLVLSGGQGEGEPQTEARAMKAYLAEQGVPEERMLLEERSSSTVENIAYSRLLIADLQNNGAMYAGAPGRLPRIGILTSNFHLFRALQIAKKQGIHGAYGIASASDPVLLLHMAFRDAFAVLKDRLAGNL